MRRETIVYLRVICTGGKIYTNDKRIEEIMSNIDTGELADSQYVNSGSSKTKIFTIKGGYYVKLKEDNYFYKVIWLDENRATLRRSIHRSSN